jgi:cytochrome b
MENRQFIKVWDIAIRVFHWALVLCFAITLQNKISAIHLAY